MGNREAAYCVAGHTRQDGLPLELGCDSGIGIDGNEPGVGAKTREAAGDAGRTRIAAGGVFGRHGFGVPGVRRAPGAGRPDAGGDCRLAFPAPARAGGGAGLRVQPRDSDAYPADPRTGRSQLRAERWQPLLPLQGRAVYPDGGGAGRAWLCAHRLRNERRRPRGFSSRAEGGGDAQRVGAAGDGEPGERRDSRAGPRSRPDAGRQACERRACRRASSMDGR